MAQNGLKYLFHDTASCLAFRFGKGKCPLTKAEPPTLEVKVDRVPRAGEMLGTASSPGAGSVSSAKVELLTSNFANFILPKMGKHGGSLVEFTATFILNHPNITGGYGELWEGCRIIKVEGPPIELTEKLAVTKLELYVHNRWMKNLADGVYKSLFLLDLPMSEAAAIYKF